MELKELRKKKHVSQKELAEILHITQATVSGWETGRCQIPKEKIIDIASVLNVRPQDISRKSTNERDVINFSKDIQAIDSNNRGKMSEWIPTSKRLPNADGRYLVQTEHGDMRDAEFYKDFGENGEFGYYSDYYATNLIGFVDFEWTPYDVVAWMPLPTPYEEDEETDDKIQQILNRLEEMKSKPMELVYDVGLIQSIIDVVREVGKE